MYNRARGRLLTSNFPKPEKNALEVRKDLQQPFPEWKSISTPGDLGIPWQTWHTQANSLLEKKSERCPPWNFSWTQNPEPCRATVHGSSYQPLTLDEFKKLFSSPSSCLFKSYFESIREICREMRNSSSPCPSRQADFLSADAPTQHSSYGRCPIDLPRILEPQKGQGPGK